MGARYAVQNEPDLASRCDGRGRSVGWWPASLCGLDQSMGDKVSNLKLAFSFFVVQ
mgnify:CR=1 FL=1